MPVSDPPRPNPVFSRDGRLIAVGDVANDAPLQVFDVASRARIRTLRSIGDSFSFPAGFTNEGRLVAVGFASAAVWNLASLSPPLATELHDSNAPVVTQFSPSGDPVTLGARLAVWNTQTVAARDLLSRARVRFPYGRIRW